MAKVAKQKNYSTKSKTSKVEEPVLVYRPVKRIPAVEDFPYRKFEKIASRVPITQKEWADILHLSERTLQRYAKENKNFEGIYVDRILHIEQLIHEGLETFIDPNAFYRWLRQEKKALGQTLNFTSLNTTQGIKDLLDQLGRIQYGVYT